MPKTVQIRGIGHRVETLIVILGVRVSIECQREADVLLGLLGVGESVVHGAVEAPLVNGRSVGRGVVEREEEDVSDEVLEVGVPPEIQPLAGQAGPCFVALPDVKGALRFGVDPAVALEAPERAVAEIGRLLRSRGGGGGAEDANAQAIAIAARFFLST